MSVRLYIKDKHSGKVREYGTDQHDSLVLREDGAIEYYNLQNGDGSGTGAEYGYEFCMEDGSEPDEFSMQTLDIGGNLTGVDCWRCKWSIKQSGKFYKCTGCKRAEHPDCYEEDREATREFCEKLFEITVEEGDDDE